MNKKMKKKLHAFGHDIYFLGQDKDGTNYYLEAATWDCEWYWGGGYIESYTNNKNPEQSRDISTHNHFSTMILHHGNNNGFDTFKNTFKTTPFNDSEIWKICELMESFYIARNYSDMIHRGGVNYTNNPVSEIIKSEAEYDIINTRVIPAIMAALYKILGEDEQK